MYSTITRSAKRSKSAAEVLALRQLVAGPVERQQRHGHALAVVVQAALLHERQQAVEDGRVGLADLVEEGDLGLGQPAGGQAPILVRLEALDGDRPEQLVGDAEARQQVDEGGQAAAAAAIRRASVAIRSLLAAPGGPSRRQCWRASSATRMARTAPARSMNSAFSCPSSAWRPGSSGASAAASAAASDVGGAPLRRRRDR